MSTPTPSEEAKPITPAPAKQGGEDELTAAARRGLLFIPLAKAWFLIAGLALQVLLPRALGSAALYGVWTLVLAWLSWPNNVVVTGTIQAVAHFAAKGTGAVEEAKRTALRMNIFVGGGAALLFFLLAPLIAAFEHDGELTSHLRLASIIVATYSFYAVFVGAANGARQFHKQAGLDMSFAALRVGLVLTAAGIFHATLPAVGGFVVAALIILVVSAAWVGLPRPSKPDVAPIAIPQMLGYIAWLLVYLLSTNVLMFVDGWWLKRLCTEAAIAAGQTNVKENVDALVGIYGAAQTVARLPYQLILAATFVVFPLLSTPALQADRARVGRYVTATLRYSAVAMLAMVVALGARPEATLRLLYPAEYATGAPALAVLLAAYACYSLLIITGSITNSLGRTRATAAIGIVSVLGTTASVYFSIKAGIGMGQPLRTAALGLLIGMGGGLLISLMYLWSTLRVGLPPLSVVRIGAAVGVALYLGRRWPAPGTAGLLGSKLGTLLAAGVLALVFLLVLFLLRELSIKELLLLRRERPRGGGEGGAAA